MNPLIFGVAGKLIDKFFPDKKEASKRKAELAVMEMNGELKELEQAVKIITAEANSDSFIAKNWRPITMLVFVIIIANNYILYPYISLFWAQAPMLEIPPDMWALLKIGLGGYIISRGGEKITNSLKQSNIFRKKQ